MKNILIGIVFAIVLVALLLKLSSPSLEGEWTASLVVDNQTDTLSIGEGSFRLSVEDDTYQFQSNISQTEEGRLSIRGKDILIHPHNADAYRMHIVEHSKDKLHLEMIYDGNDRAVIFHRSIP